MWPAQDLEDRRVSGMLRGKEGGLRISHIAQNTDGLRKDFELHPEGKKKPSLGLLGS